MSDSVSVRAKQLRVQKVISPVSVRRIRLSSPPCTVGITDGSERGEYVAQRHILQQTGRPHHVVNLMFQYYPDMEGWPTQGVNWRGFYRNGNLNEGDGYFPLVLEEGGRWGRLYLRQIEDVRSHGQEPQLTLTLHANTPDEWLIRLAKSLAPYAPMRVRINHECNGDWFHFNHRWTYKEVGDFFIRFHDILHAHAPGVRTVACWNGPGDSSEEFPKQRGQLTDDQLAPMFRIADIVSFDQYASLHYGWPEPDFDPQHPTRCFRVTPERWWQLLESFHGHICRVRGGETNVEIHEVNEDADLAGDAGQARWLSRFYTEATERRYPWLTNITFYQFRDRGGLGLERESVERTEAYEALPALAAYGAAIRHNHFAFKVESGKPGVDGKPLECRWSSSTDAGGYEYFFDVPADARTAYLRLPPSSHLLVGINDLWQIKPRGIDALPLAAELHAERLLVRVFAPPADGRNNRAGSFVSAMDSDPVIQLR